MTLELDDPTGLPSWPILVLAGREGTGKSFAAAVASGSPLIDGAIWVNYGEKRPDEYGAVKGANFKIARHDNTYKGVLKVVTEIAGQPVGDKPKLLIFDSGTRLWEIISDNLQTIANTRAIAKAKKYNKPVPTGDMTISADLWNIGKKQWTHVMLALKAHRGPVIITARLDNVSVMDEKGAPTAEKQWKIQAHKSLPYDANAIVEMPTRGEYIVTKAQSVLWELAEATQWKDFTVDGLWRRLGLESGAGERLYSEPVADEPEAIPDAVERDWVAEADAATSSADASKIGAAAAVVLGKDHEIVARIRAIVAEKRGTRGEPAEHEAQS